MSATHIIFDPKLTGATEPYVFPFTSMLASTETISAAAVTAEVYSGTDATPSAIISGAASISGSEVTQKITAGTVGVIYKLTCTMNTSLNYTRIMTAFLAVIPTVT